MGDLGLLILYVVLGVGGYKIYKYIQYRKSGINVVRFSQELDDLNFQRDRMMALHNMMTDIDTCCKKDDTWKCFNISWKNEVTGEILDYDLYIYDNKNDNAKILKDLVQVEMINMKPKLNEDIERLKIRSKMMGNKHREIVQDAENENHYVL